jgi:hypothetical protein
MIFMLINCRGTEYRRSRIRSGDLSPSFPGTWYAFLCQIPLRFTCTNSHHSSTGAGTLKTSTCTACRHRVDTSVLLPAIVEREVPLCERCLGKQTLAMAAAAETGERKRKRGPVVGIYKVRLSSYAFISCITVLKAQDLS